MTRSCSNESDRLGQHDLTFMSCPEVAKLARLMDEAEST
jgi:hypothetical protein